MDQLFSMDWRLILDHTVLMALAFALALPIGVHRIRASQPVGLRTFPLVSVAAAGYILLGKSVFGGSIQAEARLLQGLITGIGFLGGGVIVHEGIDVEGTATAASIWNTAAIGAAVAYGRLEIALVLAGANFLLLLVLTPASRELNEHHDTEDLDG
jgi:putative Mg2+ transporter-C (MgtC) family protein